MNLRNQDDWTREVKVTLIPEIPPWEAGAPLPVVMAAELRHFILTFHDSTLQVIAKGFSVSVHEIPREELNTLMLKQIVRYAR